MSWIETKQRLVTSCIRRREAFLGSHVRTLRHLPSNCFSEFLSHYYEVSVIYLSSHCKNKCFSGLDGPGQLAALCKYAWDNCYSIRAVGTGSSWSRLTHTKDILVEH